jgi:hypothetical protein
MTRVLLCLADEALETALLQDGHRVRRLLLETGALARLTGWSMRRSAAAFGADAVLAAAADTAAAEFAGQSGLPCLVPPADTAFLLDAFLPAPFRATPTAPVVAIAGASEPGALTLPADGGFLVPPDIAVLAAGPAAMLAGWMAAGCAIVAPDTEAVRAYVAGDVTALLYPPDDTPARKAAVQRLLADDGLRNRLSASARAAFEARHAAARAALRALFSAAR